MFGNTCQRPLLLAAFDVGGHVVSIKAPQQCGTMLHCFAQAIQLQAALALARPPASPMRVQSSRTLGRFTQLNELPSLGGIANEGTKGILDLDQ
jgi:hypothetical protein